MSGDPSAATKLPPLQWYAALARRTDFRPDPAQQRAVERLQRLYDELLAFKRFRDRPFVKTLDLGTPPKGLYLHGGVGRGKSMLMDAFFANLPYRRKRREHFHAFMRGVHQSMAQLKNEVDPLVSVAAHIARNVRVLCLDELHVNDIGDAMILGRLLEQLFANGVVLITTSNYAPGELYKDGLQRERFLPAIAIMQQHLDIVSVNGPTDFRLRQLEKVATYHTPLGAQAEQSMSEAFAALYPSASGAGVLVVNARKLQVKRVAPDAVWFEFAELCATARSQLDYLEIVQEFHSVFVSNVPRMNSDEANAARRFTWLVDIAYDHRVKLVLSAETMPEMLYTEGLRSEEFARTVSRLQEMQSRDYLAQAHVAGLSPLPPAGEGSS
jgi:cell division protein ZapE